MANGTVVEESSRSRGRKVWKWIGISLLLAFTVLFVVGELMVRRAGPILKGRVIETLSTRFNSRVELRQFDVSVLRGLEVTGEGLEIYPPDDVVDAGWNHPIITIQHFEFHTPLSGLFIKPMHVGTVRVSGLEVNIPPREMRAHGAPTKKHGGKMKIVVDEIVCDDSRLLIGTLKPGKDPKDFELQHIVMHDVGPNKPWQYDATLINAIPKGDIHANGTFGPWDVESPGDSSITGKYTFDHADLNTIRGLGGMLSSVGAFDGQLNKINVHGTTQTPDFSLDTANHPVPLETKFEAVVDGTSGDTYLNSVDAQLGQTHFTTHGSVVNVKGQGHIVDLDLDVPQGRIEDFLAIAVKTRPVVLTGVLGMKAHIHIPPGKERIAQKLALKGTFSMQRIHFTNPETEDKVDMMSLRAQGDPKAAKPGAEDVQSQMKGTFNMANGKMDFSNLLYTLPGGSVHLVGVYTLDGREFEFHGNVKTEAKLSQMVASRWKSILLKPVDHFFKGDGGGAEIPVKISGTNSAPKFGLDWKNRGKDEADDSKDKK